MIVGIGTDIVEIERVQNIYKKFGARFLSKIYTQNEIKIIKLSQHKLTKRLANRFAGKEALFKALGGKSVTPTLSWKDVEIINLDSGKPKLILHNLAQKYCIELIPNDYNLKIHISLSDERQYAIASVIIECIK